MADDDKDFEAARAQYRAAPIEYVPVRMGRSKVVHATTVESSVNVACETPRGKKRLIVVAAPLDCPGCLLAVGFDSRPRKTKRRRAKR